MKLTAVMVIMALPMEANNTSRVNTVVKETNILMKYMDSALKRTDLNLEMAVTMVIPVLVTTASAEKAIYRLKVVSSPAKDVSILLKLILKALANVVALIVGLTIVAVAAMRIILALLVTALLNIYPKMKIISVMVKMILAKISSPMIETISAHMLAWLPKIIEVMAT